MNKIPLSYQRRPFFLVCSIRIALILVIIVAIFQTGFAQDPVFVEDTDEYVEAPAFDNAGQAGFQQAPASTTLDQFHTGFLNLEFYEPLYYQFSGNSIFQSGSLPDSFLLFGTGNLAWNRIVPLGYRYLPAFSYGADIMYFSSTSNDAYDGDESVTGPSINLSLVFAGANVKAYFLDPYKPLLHPFAGIGWGMTYGHINTQLETGATFSTTLSGLQVYRTLGVEVQLSDSAGLLLEFRLQDSDVTTSNDPFTSSNTNRSLDLSGAMIGLAGLYRF